MAKRREKLDRSRDRQEELLGDLARLWSEADELWEQNQNAPPFRGYVSADYQAVYESLVALRGRVETILEWGSGLGIVTIMASRLGFEAYGIEAEPALVEHSENLALRYGADARFVQGSFIPEEFDWNPADGDEVDRTDTDFPSAYAELGMEIRDFDLVYAYPWPDEQIMFRSIMRQFGRKDALFLMYDAREGIQLVPFRDR